MGDENKNKNLDIAKSFLTFVHNKIYWTRQAKQG